MGIIDPGTITVECDTCNDCEEFSTTSYSGDGSTQTEMFGVEADTLEDEGWTISGGCTLCPNCKEEE